jgi:hypothetical protein
LRSSSGSDGLAPHAAQRRRLRLAAALGQRFGEVGEEHGEPQPQRDRQHEALRRLAVAAERLHPQQAGEDAADVDDEHHRVAPLHARVELLEGLRDGRLDQRRVEQRERCLGVHDWVLESITCRSTP